MDLNRLKNFFRNQAVMMTGLSFLAFLLAILIWVIFPLIKNINFRSDNFQRKLIEQQVAGEKIAKLGEMEQLNEQYRSKKSELEKFFQSDQEVDFIQALEKAAEDSKIKIKIDANDQGVINKESAGASKDEVQKNLKYKNYFILKVTTNGDYAGFLRFVYQMEHFKYFINILSFSGEMKLPDNVERVVVFNPFGNNEESNSSIKSQAIFEGTLVIAVYTN